MTLKNVSILTAFVLFSTEIYAQTVQGVYIAGGYCKTLRNASENVYEIGYGLSKYFDNGFMWGVELDLGMVDAQSNDGYYYGGDFKLGITPFSDFAVYGIGAVIWQDFENGLSGGGFGYGGGAEYRLTSWFTLAGEYKTYNMTYDRIGVEEDYNSALLKMKFTF